MPDTGKECNDAAERAQGAGTYYETISLQALRWSINLTDQESIVR